MNDDAAIIAIDELVERSHDELSEPCGRPSRCPATGDDGRSCERITSELRFVLDRTVDALSEAAALHDVLGSEPAMPEITDRAALASGSLFLGGVLLEACTSELVQQCEAPRCLESTKAVALALRASSDALACEVARQFDRGPGSIAPHDVRPTGSAQRSPVVTEMPA